MKNIIKLLFAISILLSACVPTSSDVSYPSYPADDSSSSADPSKANDYSPKPEDASLIRAEAYVDTSDLLTLESYPLQFMLNLKGNLPTPCHQLRVSASAPDAENKIYVEVYSVVSADKVCTQVLSPFDVNYPLGSFATGHYILFVNGNQVAEFDS